jgi:DNA-directed RNA polymerase specialized sigma24 family protein
MKATIGNHELGRLQAGTKSLGAWRTLDELYKSSILSIVRSKGIFESECEDVWQETLATMIRKGFEKFDRDKSSSGRFFPFLRTVAENRALDMIRSRSRRPYLKPPPQLPDEQGSFLETIPDCNPTPDALACISGDLEIVHMVLDALIEFKLVEKETVDCVKEQFEHVAYGYPSIEEIAQKYGHVNPSTGRILGRFYQAKSSLMFDLVTADQFIKEAQNRLCSTYTERTMILGAIECVRKARSEKRKSKSTEESDNSRSDALESSIIKCITLKEKRGVNKILTRIQLAYNLFHDLEVKPDKAALIYQGPNKKKPEFCLVTQALVVGRDPTGHAGENLLAIPGATNLSRNHFQIRQRDDGLFVLSDPKSTNGTFVNSEEGRLKEHLLKRGDLIYAGGVLFSFIGDPDSSLETL